MRSSVIATLFLIAAISGRARADREWPPEAYADVVARANAHHKGERHDPQEDDPQLKAVFAAADARALRGLTNASPDDAGFIKLFWRVKKSVLLRQYGIHWKSPAELNPTRSYGPPDA
jgi:hypothetical protein